AHEHGLSYRWQFPPGEEGSEAARQGHRLAKGIRTRLSHAARRHQKLAQGYAARPAEFRLDGRWRIFGTGRVVLLPAQTLVAVVLLAGRSAGSARSRSAAQPEMDLRRLDDPGDAARRHCLNHSADAAVLPGGHADRIGGPAGGEGFSEPQAGTKHGQLLDSS